LVLSSALPWRLVGEQVSARLVDWSVEVRGVSNIRNNRIPVNFILVSLILVSRIHPCSNIRPLRVILRSSRGLNPDIHHLETPTPHSLIYLLHNGEARAAAIAHIVQTSQRIKAGPEPSRSHAPTILDTLNQRIHTRASFKPDRRVVFSFSILLHLKCKRMEKEKTCNEIDLRQNSLSTIIKNHDHA
jgi:hypothetical protein